MQQGPGGTQAEASITIRANTAQPAVKSRRLTGRSWSYTITSWLGLVPFLLFCLLFELLPAVVIIQGSFTDSNTNAATLNNYQRMFSQAGNFHAFQTSISISLVTALSGAIFGFVATLGVTGFVTASLHDWLHINLYDLGFNLYTFGGLVLVYTYFQLPLMILVTVPALSALRPEWREAATNLGASSITYRRLVALPIFFPSLIAAAMILFANSFGAYATAVALAQGNINIVPVLIGFVVAGNVNIDTGLGNALAVGMIVVLLIAVSLYTTMLRRVNTWQGR